MVSLINCVHLCTDCSLSFLQGTKLFITLVFILCGLTTFRINMDKLIIDRTTEDRHNSKDPVQEE